MSNIPGPGRMIGRIISLAGRRLERTIVFRSRITQQVDEETSFGGRSRVASFGKGKQLFTIQEGAVEPNSLPDHQGETLDTIYEDQEGQEPAISDVVQIQEVEQPASKVKESTDIRKIEPVSHYKPARSSRASEVYGIFSTMIDSVRHLKLIERIRYLPSRLRQAKYRAVPEQNDNAKTQQEVKILLFGGRDSGKSTVAKQMKIIYDNGYTDRERESYKEIIFSNMINFMRHILEALEISLAPQNYALATQLIEGDVLFPDVIEALRGLWQDPGVQAAVCRSHEFPLYESAVYFFSAIDRITAPRYIPTNQDILRSRVISCAISETSFTFEDVMYRVSDFGRINGDRKKWIHYFNVITAVLFVVDMSQYDQMFDGNPHMNKMSESLVQFEAITNSQSFASTFTIIVLLNKIDRFAEKLKHSPISDYFPDYTGDDDDYMAVCKYFRHRFISANQNRDVYVFCTCATDTKQMKFSLDAVRHIFKRQHVPDCILL